MTAADAPAPWTEQAQSTEQAQWTEEFERITPPLTERTAPFWTSGADGVLRILRCGGCGRYQHPPLPLCPACHSADMSWQPVSGNGVIWSWTINRYQWVPSMPPPYVVAEVELAEQPGLRLQTNIVGADPADIRIGMAVTVCFTRSGEAYIPLFRPATPR
jgi:uncharacterized OB-fold protein